MPAAPTSLIAVLSPHAGSAGVDPDEDLLVVLAGVPDPRAARGCRYRLVTVLAVAVAAVLTGASSFVAIAEWAHDLPVSARLRVGIGRRAPSESTIRRVTGAVDDAALGAVLSGWLIGRLPVVPTMASVRLWVVPVDGKTARGARTADWQVDLLAAFDQASGVVLGQSTVPSTNNEITAFAPLPDCLTLVGGPG